MQRVLDVRLQLVTVNLIDEVDLLQSLRTRQQRLLVANDVSIVRRGISRVHIEVDCRSPEVSLESLVLRMAYETLTGR